MLYVIAIINEDGSPSIFEFETFEGREGFLERRKKDQPDLKFALSAFENAICSHKTAMNTYIMEKLLNKIKWVNETLEVMKGQLDEMETNLHCEITGEDIE